MGLPGTLLSLCLCTGWPDFCCSFHCAFLTRIWYEHIAPCSVVRSCTNMCAFLVTRAFSAFKRAVGDSTVFFKWRSLTLFSADGRHLFSCNLKPLFKRHCTVTDKLSTCFLHDTKYNTLGAHWPFDSVTYVLKTCNKTQPAWSLWPIVATVVT